MDENLLNTKEDVVVQSKQNQPKQEKKKPVCARCKKEKKLARHHFPVGSKRMALICHHCYTVVKRQRTRSRGFGHS